MIGNETKEGKETSKLSSELATVKFSVSHPTKDVDDRVDWSDASG